MLGAAAAGTATLAASTALAPSASATTSSLAASPSGALQSVGVTPVAAKLLGGDSTLHLLRRATYGLSPSLVSHAKGLGSRAWLEEQLAPKSIKDTTADAMLTHFPRLSWSIPSVWNAQNRSDNLQVDNYSYDVMMDLLYSHIGRALWSKRQLFEVMVDFWSNHLNVTCPNGDVWDNRHRYDRDVIRPNTFGKFRTMLLASAKHPAMLVYLNQRESNKDAPNENYARELLELHSVGVDGGYAEQDIYAAARLLTGLSLWNPSNPEDWKNQANPPWTRQEFVFDAGIHDTTAGKVLGFDWSAHNKGEGYDLIVRYVNYLARHRKTAERIAYKLGERFVADDPPKSLVSRLADVYQANDTAIVPVLRALFTSREFRYSAGMKVRRPFEDLVAGLRAIGVNPSKRPNFPTDGGGDYFGGFGAVYYQSRDLGHAPMAWGQPNGYPDTGNDWQSANGMLGRWNNHRSYVNGWWPSATNNAFTWPAKPTIDGWKPEDLPLCRGLIPAKLPATYGELVDLVSDRLIQQRMRGAHRDAVLTFFGKTAASPLSENDGIVRWQFGDLLSLVLDSPYHALR